MYKSACVASPLNCSLPPLGSSSNVSHSLGGFCMIASLPPPPATSLIPFFLFLRHPGQSSLPAVNQVWSLQIRGSWAWNVLCLPLSPPGSLLSKLQVWAKIHVPPGGCPGLTRFDPLFWDLTAAPVRLLPCLGCVPVQCLEGPQGC